jgi:exodeoxyribonuclease VII small subunit
MSSGFIPFFSITRPGRIAPIGRITMATSPSKNISEDPQEQLSDAPSFEQTLGRLEEIVHLLEEGKIGLDEAMGRYEEGVGLLRKAYELLETAQRRISLLSGVDSEGNPILRPMEDAASFSLERDAAGPSAAMSSREKPNTRRGRRQADPDSL